LPRSRRNVTTGFGQSDSIEEKRIGDAPIRSLLHEE
jgi:hypothetical protein